MDEEESERCGGDLEGGGIDEGVALGAGVGEVGRVVVVVWRGCGSLLLKKNFRKYHSRCAQHSRLRLIDVVDVGEMVSGPVTYGSQMR